MAEPAGIFIEITIDEKGVKNLLNRKFEQVSYGKKLGYFFSELLYDCKFTAGNIFIFNYDKKTNKCFIAWLLNHFEKSQIEPFDEVLEVLSSVKTSETVDYAIAASTYPEVLSAYQITDKKVSEIAPETLPENVAEHLTQKFWSFSKNNSFPEPDKALRKRNYLYKNFKNYYQKYLLHIEEIEKPAKIAQATKEKPYHLFDDFYTYDEKVFEIKTYTNQVIEILGADPYTLKMKANFLMDKNHLFCTRLAPNSPPNTIDSNFGPINNSKAIWEWRCIG